MNFRRRVDWQPSSRNLPVGMTDTPEWKLLGIHVTGIPDAVYPWHFDDVKAIRRNYDPGFIPLFRRMVYLSPAGSIVPFIHHGFGYYDPDAEPDHRFDSCLMPTTGIDWKRPNVMGFWFEPHDRLNTSLNNRYGLPAPFRPWGDWIVSMCAEAYEESSKEKKQAREAAHESSPTEKALNAALEEARYTEREEAPLQKEILESMSSSDFKEMEARTRGWTPEHEAKPFADLGQKVQ